MIETEIQKLTAAVTQLTVTAEALLETLRHQSGKGPVAQIEMQPVVEEPTPKPKKVKAAKVEQPPPAKVEEAPAAPVEQSYTVEDLRAEAQKALINNKSVEIVALNKHYGVKRISEVSPDLYVEIITKLREINGQT